ncbi:MAG: peroxiredoxin [Acidimicrobiaceae bacterium]|nr:peroxiredoxin [Acidimicrobiaceae bacterium]
MSIAVGEKLPDVTVRVPSPEGPKAVQTAEVLGTGRVVLFGVPGAFTPTCSDYHLPGYVLRAEDLRGKGVDTIACVAVNDVFVMGAWAADREVGDKVLMLADGAAEFTKALGLEMDLSGLGLGIRSRRYAMVLQDGIVTDLSVEEGPGLDVSSADATLAKL